MVELHIQIIFIIMYIVIVDLFMNQDILYHQFLKMSILGK
jgi:hypothetical protein